MSSIAKVNKNSLGLSCIQAGIQFAYGRLWTFLEGCTSYASTLFRAVFIGAEEPPPQIRVEPKPEVNNDSDDEFYIPAVPISPRLAKKIPRSKPIKIPAGSPKEEKLRAIEENITILLKKPKLTQEEQTKINMRLSHLEHFNERMSGPSFSPRIKELNSELENKLKKNK